MRVLTLNEKITIKGILKKGGYSSGQLCRLTTDCALYLWNKRFGYKTSIADYAKLINWKAKND